MSRFDAQHHILALDFDGVVVDSIEECLVSGYNAYANYRGQENIERYEQLDADWAAQARRMRNYIRNGEDYVFIAHALAQGAPVHQQNDFDAFLARHQHLREGFFEHMLNQRLDFSAAHAEAWAALNPFYDGMIKFLTDYAPKENLYIITTKKLLFVHKILAANNISLIDDNVRDTSDGLSKRQIIEEILQKRSAAPEMFHFIDDQIDTLIKVRPTGVNVALAAWGYNNDEQMKQAETEGIEVMQLRGFFEKFA